MIESTWLFSFPNQDVFGMATAVLLTSTSCAARLGLSTAAIERMESAFEHRDLEAALALK